LFPVRVVVEIRRGRAGHGDQAILGVIVQREGLLAKVAGVILSSPDCELSRPLVVHHLF
jgi:hypothetical protein